MRLKTSPIAWLGVFNNTKDASDRHEKSLRRLQKKNNRDGRALGTSSAFSALAVLLSVAVFTGVTHAGSPTVVDESGTLAGDTTWTPDNVYVLTGQVEIPSGVTLTIEAGTVVKDSNSYYIKVDSGGSLDGTGSSSNPITFTSINDNSVGGSTGSGSPAVDDYWDGIELSGGTVDLSFATFEYAGTAIADVGGDSGSSVTVTDSTFSSEYSGVNLSGAYWTSTLSLERNSFELNTPSSGSLAVDTNYDSDLSGISLSGVNENTFTGSGNNVAVGSEGHSGVASGTTWEVSTSSGVTKLSANGDNSITVNGTLSLDSNLVLATNGFPAIPVNGTANLASGVIVKGSSNTAAFQVNPGGILDGTGTSGSPIIFTSINDNSVGGSTGSGSPAAADYSEGVELNGGTVNVSYANFEYANQPIADVGGDSGSSVTVANSSFINDNDGVNLSGTSGSTTLSLQGNTFNLGTASSTNYYAVEVDHDSDLAGIVLSGVSESVFDGSGKNVVVEIGGPSDVPSGSTWTVNSSSGVTLSGWGSTPVTVEGTVNLDSGVVLKGQSNGSIIEVNSGGTLNGIGTSTAPVYFTSINDNSVGASIGSGSPAVADYASAIELNGGTVNTTYANFEYANTALFDTSGGNNSSVTVSNGTLSNNNLEAYFLQNDQANFGNVTMSSASNGLEVYGTAHVVYRGSFSSISNKAIQACNWDSDSENGCKVDAAYTDWGSSSGPFASVQSNDMACGSVTVSPWVYSGTNYTNNNLYSVPNCDGSITPDTALTNAANSYSTSLANYYTSCQGGLQSACTAYNNEISCLEDVINLAATATGEPITLPNDDSHQWAVDAPTVAGDFISGAGSTMQANELGSVSGYEAGYFSLFLNVVTFIHDADNAYNQCVQ